MIYYCCNSMRRLDRMNYISDHKIYLQRHSIIQTNLPIDLRKYRYCITCGLDVNEHPSNIDKSKEPIKCTMLMDGLLGERIAPRRTDDSSINEKEYVCNFNTLPKQEINYPQSVRIDYCPYCGYSHTTDHTSIHTNNFFLLAEYSV